MIPAHAGMNRLSDLLILASLGVPRACGDEPFGITTAQASIECSPRNRACGDEPQARKLSRRLWVCSPRMRG